MPKAKQRTFKPRVKAYLPMTGGSLRTIFNDPVYAANRHIMNGAGASENHAAMRNVLLLMRKSRKVGNVLYG